MAYISSAASDVETYTPVTTSGSITYTGISSGTDWNEVIEAELTIEGYLRDEYEEKLDEQEYVLEQLELFQDALDTYQEALEALDSIDEFLDVEISGDGDEINVEADGTASAQSHTIVVNQLAASDVWVNSGYGFDSEDEEVTDSATTMSFTFGGTEYTIDIAEGTTLEELVDQINANSEINDLVQASILDDGTNQYFVLSSVDTGADNAITITETGTMTTITTANLENTQTACDAELKVDGFPSGEDEWITRSDNSIDDIITGLTLELQDVTDADGITITASYDEDALMEKIEDFITATNQIIYDIQVLTGKVETTYEDDDGETQTAPTIQSYALELMYADVKSMLSSAAQGFDYYDSDTGTGDVYSALSQLGIYTDSDEDSDTWGQLLYDEDELEEAIVADPKAVADLFTEDDSVSVSGSGLQFVSKVDTVTGGGEYEVEYTVENGEVVSATIDGVAMSLEGGNTILATSDSDAAGLLLEVTNLTDGTYSSTVSVKQGKVLELISKVDTWSDSEEGALAILISSMEDSIESLEDDIYDEEQRLETLENELIRKYAALESALAEFSALEEEMQSLMSSLDSD